MASTFGTLEIAKSGMMTYNAAVQTTSHNISNINTKGYSRQTTNYSAMVSNKSSSTVQGFGVGVIDVTRDRNEYYDEKYIRTQSAYNKYETDTYYLNSIQDMICGDVTSKTKGRIMDAFDDFYSTLSNLVGNPNNMTMRTQAMTKAETFTEFMQGVGKNLQQLQDEANTAIKTVVEQINAYADKIVSLNRQIYTVEAYGSVANDLRDQRSTLLDELSQYANVEYMEKDTYDDHGNKVDTQYCVYMNGNTLLDTYHTNKIQAIQKETYSNINDIEGCYALKWEDGSNFSMYNKKLGGQLQSLFEMRDGNNNTALQGTISKVTESTIVIEDSWINLSDEPGKIDINQLNIPQYDGEITIGSRKYYYDSFDADFDKDTGKFTFTFNMKTTGGKDYTKDAVIKDIQDLKKPITLGSKVDAKGIPYYMAQLNEFVRTFSEEFNTVHKNGATLYTDDPSRYQGTDFFNGTVAANGENFNFSMKEKTNAKGELNDISFTSKPELDAADNVYYGSYYYLTVMNFGVTKEVQKDPKLLACNDLGAMSADGKEREDVGTDNWGNIQLLAALKDKSDMFLHGAPDTFIQTMTSSVGVEASKASNMAASQSNLLYAIDSNRKSVSGVDEDEEAENLMIFQQMLFNQYKVLSVMNQVLDKLINGTAV